MKFFYSKTTNTFYPEEFKDIYQKNLSWPKDAVEVEYSIFKEYGETTAPTGKIRKPDSDGMPVWTDLEISLEHLYLAEESWVKSELDRAAEELNKVQDSDPKAIGTVADWRAYRRALRAWPDSEDYPETSKRPISPDN